VGDAIENAKLAKEAQLKATGDLRTLREKYATLQKDSKSSQQQLNKEQQRVRDLTRELETCTAQKGVLSKKLSQSQAEQARISQAFDTLNIEKAIRACQDAQQVAQHSTVMQTPPKPLQHPAHTRLIQQHERVQDELRKEKAEVEALKDSQQTLRKEFDDLTGELSDARKKIKEKSRMIKTYKDDLKEQLKTASSKERLVRIGAAVRLRFLEQAREKIDDVPRRDLDLAIIEEGNSAAHRADGDADKALFENDLVPEDSLSDLKKTFKDLYHPDHDTYDFDYANPELLQDCRATLRTLQARDRFYEASDLRAEFNKLDIEISDAMAILDRPGGNIDDDNYINGKIEELQELTDRIVQFERSNNFRRRR
jgi:predicted nuclease with TOPRIM domain